MAEEDALPQLSKLFLSGWEARRKLDACELSAGTPEHSSCVTRGVAALEKATELASHVSLLSDNEDLDELPTSSLKYLLLPALLGELTLQQTVGERMKTILKARVYFVDFLRRCRDYGVTKEDPPSMDPPVSDPPVCGASEQPEKKSYNQLAAERAAKIQRLKEKKELERRTEELTATLNEGGGGSGEEVDEEQRDQWVALLKLNVYKSREFVKSIEDEIPILRHMETIKKGEEPVAKQPEMASGCGPPRQPAKPIVITRDMLRGQVFGAGYPSVPTMTVEEFYQQRYGEQQRPPAAEETKLPREEEEEEVDEKDEDSDEAVKKAREWDEFKDENRRGWGNKKNMG